MKRSSPSLQFLAAAASSSSASTTTTTTMSLRPNPTYRGRGRYQWRRGFSNRPFGPEDDQFVAGDPHFRSVCDANREFRPVERGNFARPPPFISRPNFDTQNFNQNQPFRSPGATNFNRNPHFRPQGLPHFHENYQFRPSPQHLRQRPRKPLDYRNWEYAKSRPPPNCDRFTILSYNILADYLAIDHRSKLYFHIPRHILDWEFRKRNIVFELGLWSADIMCFQEVDRFQDLEEELKVRGYTGIWKMRTGVPVDGCAIFWRASRFKLLHEEFIEFNKLGLRDNVAQICILESLNQNRNSCTSALPTSSEGPNKVIICNIHVLYNPKRGDIKLGQVRVLLDRAYAISKLWDDAPVVLCGDFNCTPKSSLYNFIAEQKLLVSGLPRDKISGQDSAEIHPRRPYISNHRVQTSDNSIPSPASVDDREVGQNDTQLDKQIKNSSDIHSDNLHFTSSFYQTQSINAVLNVSTSANLQMPHDDENSMLSYEPTKEVQGKDDVCKDVTELALQFQATGLNESPSGSHNGDDYPDIERGGREQTHDTSNESYGSSVEPSRSDLHAESENLYSEKGMDGNYSKTMSTSNLDVTLSEPLHVTSVPDVLEVSSPESTVNLSSVSVTNDKNPSTMYEADISSQAQNVNLTLGEAMDKLTPNEVDEATEDESFCEDSTKFLSELHNPDGHLPSDFVDSDESSVERDEIPEVLGHSSGINHVPFDVEKPAYDPSAWTSAWTPMEIETATGSSECTLMEHPLKLRSTYSEVEDFSGTRDSYGEPQVTSYHRAFLGAVDYIWRSEGLQTVRVLAPIPKHAMLWTPGFPTKKWGSDHIALVTELAFRKDESIQNAEVR